VAGYPRTHSFLKPADRDRALIAKYEFAVKHGIEMRIKTQICSRVKYIASWLEHVRKIDIDAGVTVCLLGPAPLKRADKHLRKVGVTDAGLILKRVASGNIVDDLALLRFDPVGYLKELEQSAGGSDGISELLFNPIGDYNTTLDLISESQALLDVVSKKS
jgi:hypothetical protein